MILPHTQFNHWVNQQNTIFDPNLLDTKAHARLWKAINGLPENIVVTIHSVMTPDAEYQAVLAERYKPKSGLHTLVRLLSSEEYNGNAGGRNLQNTIGSRKIVKPYEVKAFSGAEGDPQKPDTSISLAPRKRGPSNTRKSRYRDITKLKPWQVADLHLADAHASRIGAPLNTFITVAWFLTETGDLDAAAFQRGNKRMAQWLRDKGATPAYIYAHENPASKLGDAIPNTHLLVHVPTKHKSAFKAKLPGWFGATLDGATKVEPRTRRGYKGPDRLQYMAKGADNFTCRRHGGYRKPGGQGVVWIKRSGVSQNLGQKARDSFYAQYARGTSRPTTPMTGGKP
jgi:hypothetical protein